MIFDENNNLTLFKKVKNLTTRSVKVLISIKRIQLLDAFANCQLPALLVAKST